MRCVYWRKYCGCKSSVVAKNKYNATVICDCGTKHVLEQNKILSQIPSARRIAYSVIKRELKITNLLIISQCLHSIRWKHF